MTQCSYTPLQIKMIKTIKIKHDFKLPTPPKKTSTTLNIFKWFGGTALHNLVLVKSTCTFCSCLSIISFSLACVQIQVVGDLETTPADLSIPWTDCHQILYCIYYVYICNRKTYYTLNLKHTLCCTQFVHGRSAEQLSSILSLTGVVMARHDMSGDDPDGGRAVTMGERPITDGACLCLCPWCWGGHIDRHTPSACKADWHSLNKLLWFSTQCDASLSWIIVPKKRKKIIHLPYLSLLYCWKYEAALAHLLRFGGRDHSCSLAVGKNNNN